MKKRLLPTVLLIWAVLLITLSGCNAGSSDNDQNLLLYLPFDEDSDGLSLFAEGGSVTVAELYVAQMGSIYTSQDE